MHRHWHFSYCRLLWQDSLHHCRLLRALWTALIPYWSAAQAWWLVTHLSRGLLTARYLKAIKNKKDPASYCSKMSAMVKHFIVRDQFCPARIKLLCTQDSFWGRQVQNNSHRNQFLSFLGSRHLYTENHLCLQNKPLALQLHGLSQGDSKCKEFVIACRTKHHWCGAEFVCEKREKQHSPPSSAPHQINPHLQGGEESFISQANCKGKRQIWATVRTSSGSWDPGKGKLARCQLAKWSKEHSKCKSSGNSNVALTRGLDTTEKHS